MRIKIQPRELSNGTLPYPFFVDEDGMVGRQDFWKGNPKKFIGFSEEPKAGDIKYARVQYFNMKVTPEVSGMYPVFERDDGSWYTGTNPIESVKFLES